MKKCYFLPFSTWLFGIFEQTDKMFQQTLLVATICLSLNIQGLGFQSPVIHRQPSQQQRSSSATALHAAATKKCTPLPQGLSPFEKSLSKSLDLQGNFRKIAGAALGQALRDGVKSMEIEFPPLLGGDMAKSQFGTFALECK